MTTIRILEEVVRGKTPDEVNQIVDKTAEQLIDRKYRVLANQEKLEYYREQGREPPERLRRQR